MTFAIKQILKIVLLFLYSLSFSQTNVTDSLRGQFTYLLQSKPNNLNRDYIYTELFSLQVSDNRAFYISENKLKFDSAFTVAFNNNIKNIDLTGLSALKSSNYIIIQNNNNFQYYTSVGMTLLTYTNPSIENWKLVDETKIISKIKCKKAEVSYKGRKWTAWYSPDIPFPYGPYKFSGLPGLIVKITDETGDYDFELVRSVSTSALKRKLVSVSNVHYQNAKLVTKKELILARKNFRENAKHELENLGTVFFDDKKEKQKNYELETKAYNPMELED